MAGMFMPQAAPTPMTPPSAPTIDSAAVQQQANNALKQRAQAQGRASTLLTDPSSQRTPYSHPEPMTLG